MRILLDSNILVSGLFYEGREKALLNEVLRKKIVLVLPDVVLKEVRKVIERKFSNDPRMARALFLLELLEYSSEMVSAGDYTPFLETAFNLIRDKKDAPILAAAFTSKPDFLVTGDNDFLVLAGRLEIKIVSSKDFFERYYEK